MTALETSHFFKHVDPQELRRISQERKFSAGQDIFKEGDEGDGVFLVQEGLVEISGRVGDKIRHVYSQAGPGDIFGEMAVIENKPRSAWATAAKETTVFFIPKEEMRALVERSPTLALGLLREISHRLREFNRQYLEDEIQTERLAIVGRFARSIVHDLKNPLNVIGLTAEMASMEKATLETRQKAAISIRRQIDHISEMIGEILEFMQPSTRASVLGAFNYGEFLRQVAEELQPEAALKSVAVSVEGTMPEAQVLLDPKRLRRVFYNLAHNATDAMPGGGRITLRAYSKPGEVVTEVEDTGEGIAPEIEGRMFEAFATHGKAHGTGLGLSICKRIIEDHRGWISAGKGRAGGAVFSFGLPLAKRDVKSGK
jgi:signal transduction histidine kinase